MPGMTPDEIALLLTFVVQRAFSRRSPRLRVGYSDRGRYMQTATILNFGPLANGSSDDPSLDDILGQMPELPRPRQRWTVRRKAAVIEALRGGWVPIEEICRLYTLSVDEFLAWERDNRHGLHGLRTTRYQIYRDTDARRR